MRWKKPATWIALFSLGLVLALVVLDSGRTSPGELAAAHARDARLASGGCELCHAGGGRDLAAGCLGCHTEIERQLAERRGFHGTLSGDPRGCAACHSEHHGEPFALVSELSFARAGSARAEYAHAGLGFELTGVHLELDCARCHPAADKAVLDAGERRFLGASQACAGCHEDVHAGALPRCAACHGQERPFAEVAEFEHSAAFPLVGAHGRVGCRACHAPGSPHSIEAAALDSQTAPERVRACADCHASPHASEFVAAEARARSLAPEQACAACHALDGGPFHAEGQTLSAAQHAATGFELAPPHERAACRDCHAPAARGDETRERAAWDAFRAAHPGRSADDCASCHGDPHGGQFAQGPFAQAKCTACHDALHFAPPAFELAQHARTRFPLDGAHQAVACQACHTEQRTYDGRTAPARVFHGTPAACRDCHADAHAGAFDRDGAPADCARCHDASSFARTRAPFDHARETGFALTGAHQRAACATCHVPSAQPGLEGRTFGRIDGARRTGDCASCHADVHAGAFARPEQPARVAGREGCARCHTTESFRVAPADFDHGAWTGYALEGAHARADCTVCHVPGPASGARRLGRTAVAAPAARAACTSCHLDVHRGAFDDHLAQGADTARAGCLACHTQESFSPVPAFDHGTWTGFALAGAHSAAECNACHEPVADRQGRARAFRPARGTQCADCHLDPHAAQFADAGRTDCARCHLDGPDFRSTRFDHQRDARFALDATHARLACAACHRPATLPDGTRAVRYKPLGRECADCHSAGGGERR